MKGTNDCVFTLWLAVVCMARYVLALAGQRQASLTCHLPDNIHTMYERNEYNTHSETESLSRWGRGH